MTDSMVGSESARLSPATSGFVLAATITVLLNTAISFVEDAYAPLKVVMGSLCGHDWTTQGFIDLALFVGLGLIFRSTAVAESMDPGRLIAGLLAAVIVAGMGLALWFAFV